MRPDTRSPVCAHRASPPPCRRFGAPSPRGGLPPPKGSGSILPPAPDGRRCKAPSSRYVVPPRQTSDPRALCTPDPAETACVSRTSSRRGRPEVRAVLRPPHRKRTGSDFPRPAPLRANPDRTRAVAGIHPRTSAVPDVSAAAGPSAAAGSAPTFGSTGGSVSSMRNSPSRSFCQSRIYP